MRIASMAAGSYACGSDKLDDNQDNSGRLHCPYTPVTSRRNRAVTLQVLPLLAAMR